MPNDVVKLLESLKILQALFRQVDILWNSEGIIAWCETWAMPELLPESRSWNIFGSSILIGLVISEFVPVLNSLFEILDHAAKNNLSLFVELPHFLLKSSVF